jgi:chemotaxis protein methyltransferase CheR
MYLTPNHQSHVTEKLRQCLVEGGWLITSPSETTAALSSEFVSVNFQGAIFYKKQLLMKDDCRLMIEKQPSFSPAEHRFPDNQQPEVLASQSTIIDHQSSIQGSTIDNYQSSIHLARTAADRGSLPEALGYCEKAIAADRFNPGHYYLRASILEEQGKLHEAVDDLRKALYLDQDFIPAHILLGNLTLRQENRRGSSRHFRNALRLLGRRPIEEVIPGAEGLTAGRLMEIIRSTIGN